VAEIDTSRAPLAVPVAPRPLATAPLVAALDERGQLALWAVVRPGELEKLAKRPIGWEAMFVQYPSEQHVPSVRSVRDLVGPEPLDRPRRLAVGLELGPRGLTVRVGDRDTSRVVAYLVTGEPGARVQHLDLCEVTSATIRVVAEVRQTVIVAGAVEEAAKVEEALGGSPLQLWDRQGESAWPLPTDFRFGHGPSDPIRLEGADVAIARDADGSAHVAVVTGAPPRLLVYWWVSGRGLALRAVRAVGADLALDRVP